MRNLSVTYIIKQTYVFVKKFQILNFICIRFQYYTITVKVILLEFSSKLFMIIDYNSIQCLKIKKGVVKKPRF